jgi:hypothetical protein
VEKLEQRTEKDRTAHVDLTISTTPSSAPSTSTAPDDENDGNDAEIASVDGAGAAKVLISGYYRSGSTLTGDLFAASRDTMYLYEVSATDAVQWHMARVTLGQGQGRNITQLCDRAIVQPLYNIFQCNIRALSPNTLTNNFWFSKSSACAPMQRFLNCSRHLPRCRHGYRKHCTDRHRLYECYRALYGNHSNGDIQARSSVNSKFLSVIAKYRQCSSARASRVDACAQMLQEDCHTAAVRCVKEIRLDLRLLPPLLDLDPRIKVIHLVRDPRGMMAATHTSKRVHERCDQMLSDIHAFQLTLRQYPGCCIRLRYEDLATNPTVVTSLVYKHVGVDFDKYFTKWWAKVNDPTDNRGFLGTYRANMTAEAYDWKRKLSKFAINNIMKHETCVQVIRLLGYEE